MISSTRWGLRCEVSAEARTSHRLRGAAAPHPNAGRSDACLRGAAAPHSRPRRARAGPPGPPAPGDVVPWTPKADARQRRHAIAACPSAPRAGVAFPNARPLPATASSQPTRFASSVSRLCFASSLSLIRAFVSRHSPRFASFAIQTFPPRLIPLLLRVARAPRSCRTRSRRRRPRCRSWWRRRSCLWGRWRRSHRQPGCR